MRSSQLIMASDGECLLPFILPQSSLLSGCTQSGKTFWIKKVLLNADKMFTPVPKKVIIAYTAWQPDYEALEAHWGENIEFMTNIPSKDYLLEVSSPPDHTILVIDDKMSQLGTRDVLDTVCVLCHHRLISTFILTQNLYHSGTYIRDISLNVQNIILFRNPRSLRQISTLAGQMMPGKAEFLLDAYSRAVAKDHGYLFIDLNMKSPSPKFQFRTGIFPGEQTIVYLPK